MLRESRVSVACANSAILWWLLVSQKIVYCLIYLTDSCFIGLALECMIRPLGVEKCCCSLAWNPPSITAKLNQIKWKVHFDALGMDKQNDTILGAAIRILSVIANVFQYWPNPASLCLIRPLLITITVLNSCLNRLIST